MRSSKPISWLGTETACMCNQSSVGSLPTLYHFTTVIFIISQHIRSFFHFTTIECMWKQILDKSQHKLFTITDLGICLTRLATTVNLQRAFQVVRKRPVFAAISHHVTLMTFCKMSSQRSSRRGGKIIVKRANVQQLKSKQTTVIDQLFWYDQWVTIQYASFKCHH